MTLLDFPMDARLSRIEDRLGTVERDIASLKTDLAVIKKQLEALPSRWLQIIALLAILLPIYSIMVTLLWNTIHH